MPSSSSKQSLASHCRKRRTERKPGRRDGTRDYLIMVHNGTSCLHSSPANHQRARVVVGQGFRPHCPVTTLTFPGKAGKVAAHRSKLLLLCNILQIGHRFFAEMIRLIGSKICNLFSAGFQQTAA